MNKRFYLLCAGLFLFLLPLNGYGQRASFTRALKKTAKKMETFSRPASVKNAAAAMLQSEAALGGSRMRDMLEPLFKSLPSHTKKDFTAANKHLQEEALTNFLEKEAYLSLQKELVNKAVLFQMYDATIPYSKLINPSARVILVGETHEQKRVAEEMLFMMLNYQSAYPEKRVYYASEFVDDLSVPGQGVRILTMAEVNSAVRKRPFYRPYTKRIVRSGIPVVGLEDPAVSAQAVAQNYTSNTDCPAYKRWSSPAGVDARNKHWVGIIENILQQDPNAVVFVHAGMGHTNYNQPASLAHKLRKYKPFVMEFNYALGAHMNPLLEQYAPFPQEMNRYRVQLRARNEQAFYHLLAVRVMKDKRWALAVGCDMHVFFHDWGRSR